LTRPANEDYSGPVPPELSSERVLGAVSSWDRMTALVLAARKGDEDAYREIYRAYREPVWSVIVSLVGDAPQAQDILQNVFFKAFRGLPGFRFQSALFTWLYRIARNECRNHLRKHGPATVPLDDIVGSRYEADERGLRREPSDRQEALRNAVSQLPFKMREVIVLKYQQDLTYDEMSRVLGCPSGTVASRLNRALLELEARLRPGGEGR
jgi:RNA polymerase sigma factor (sigma-70 family)